MIVNIENLRSVKPSEYFMHVDQNTSSPHAMTKNTHSIFYISSLSRPGQKKSADPVSSSTDTVSTLYLPVGKFLFLIQIFYSH